MTVSCFPKISTALRDFFSKNKASPKETNDFNHRDEGCLALEVLKAAVDKNLDCARPQSKRVASLMPRLARVIDKKLSPRGKQVQVAGEAGSKILARKTGFAKIFRHSTGKQFTVALQNGQAVARSRSEIETHVLLESYLKTRYADDNVSSGEVVHSNEFIKSPHAATPARDAAPGLNFRESARRNNAELRELRRPLLAPEYLDSVSVTDNKVLNNEVSHPGTGISEPGLRSGGQSNSGSVEESVRSAATPASSNVAGPAAPFSAVSGVSKVPPTSRGQLTPAQTRMIQFVEDRLQLSPLEFLDEISRADPMVAAYFAVQTEEMLTQARPAFAHESFAPSVHPELEVRSLDHCGPTARREVRFKDAERQAAARPRLPDDSVLSLALLDDLKREMAQQNQRMQVRPNQVDGDDTAVLPEGIRSGATNSPTGALEGSSQVSVAADVQHVCRLLNDRAGNTNDPAVRLAAIASANPAVAAFCGIADEMLLIKGSGTTVAACTRFPYLASDDLAYQMPAESANGERWYETFLPGVQRRPNNGADVWRIFDGDAWKAGQSKDQVMAHVAKEALRHVTAQDSIPAERAIYPLVVYELLAKATNASVPQYLKDAEQSARHKVMQARAQATANRQRIANLQEAAAAEREIRQQQEALTFAAERVTNRIQLTMTRSEFEPEKVMTNGSVDTTFTLAPRAGTALEMIRGIQENRLAMTHTRQAISWRHSPGGGRDNRCWLRGSWLSLLSAATPDMLTERYLARCKETAPRIAATARNLHNIASRFKADPVAFLFPEGSGNNWADRVGNSAFLEYGMRADGSGIRPSGPRQGKTTEDQLEQIQNGVASCFRFENPSIMRELQSVSMFSPASSDLPVVLHRAFRVPALIIEAGERVTNEAGEPDVRGAQIRVVAPPGSELARFLEEAARNNMPITEGSAILDELLTRFTDLPIIWLEEEHYELYLPNQVFQNVGRSV